MLINQQNQNIKFNVQADKPVMASDQPGQRVVEIKITAPEIDSEKKRPPLNLSLVIDRSAVVSAVGDVQVATSSDVYFASDSVGLRCTFRFGATIVRPDRVASFGVTAPTND